MKQLAWLAFGLAAAMAAAADAPAIYHPGWIDLNKDGRKNVYEDPAQPVARRVDDLLRRMTLAEMIGQLEQVDLPRVVDAAAVARVRQAEVGSFLGSDATVETPLVRNQLQRVAVEQLAVCRFFDAIFFYCLLKTAHCKLIYGAVCRFFSEFFF